MQHTAIELIEVNVQFAASALIILLNKTSEKENETALENDHYVHRNTIRTGVSRDDNAKGERGGCLPYGPYFRNAWLRICELGAMSGHVLRSRRHVRSQSVPGESQHRQRLCGILGLPLHGIGLQRLCFYAADAPEEDAASCKVIGNNSVPVGVAGIRRRAVAVPESVENGRFPADYFMERPDVGVLVAKYVGARTLDSIAL